jgi:curved DNA-binding protein CbpA
MAVSDPYAVLGVSRDADGPTIHTAYRRAVRRTHPDVGGTAAEFEAVQDAYETLRDPSRRAAHEARTARAPAPPPPRRRATPPRAAPPEVEPMEDFLAESRRLENEARVLAGLRPRDFGDGEKETESGDSFAAILDDAQRQLRGTAGELARELRRRARRML